TCLFDVEAKPVSWLWLNRIPIGCLSLLAGLPGLGKSLLTTEAAACVSSGRVWPDGGHVRTGTVLLITAEDDLAYTLRPRLDADRDNEVRSLLNPLHKIAEDRGIAILMIAHVRKGGAIYADDMVLGSRAFTALSRTVLHLVGDDQNKNRRLLLPGKNNLGPQA